jgi:hypothetical protein
MCQLTWCAMCARPCSQGPLPTPASFAARLYCPPFKFSAGLAAYIPFSETEGATSLVLSAECTPDALKSTHDNDAAALKALGCGNATGVARPAASAAVASTPLGTGKPAGRGPGVPSATYSTG